MTRDAQKPTVVLIPGYMLDRDMWREVEPGFAEIGAVAHADLSADASIAAMARRLLDTIAGPLVLIGFSMGGYVAREVARLAPERVIGVCLVATSARGDTAEQSRRKAAALTAVRAPFRGFSRATLSASVHPSRRSDVALIGRLRTMGERLGWETFVRQTSMERHGDLGRLGDIRCPTLIVAAEEDALRSLDESSELHQGIDGSDLVLIKNAGHMIPMEQPEEFLALVLPWLKQHAT